MLINKKITVLFIVFLTVIFLVPHIASAQDVLGINELASGGVSLGTKDLRTTIAGVINIFLGFLGTLATLIILYGGFVWMTSGGSAEKINKAKQIIINGIIGLVIILSSYAIARFILKEGYEAIFGGGVVPPVVIGGGAGLGAGALDYHYPVRYAVDVARNTNIVLTFKEPMDISMIGDTCSGGPGVNCTVKTTYINLFGQDNPTLSLPLIVNYSVSPIDGFKTFIFDPVADLGSNTADIHYRMELGDLETKNGSTAFPYSNNYYWIFTTGTEFDYTPPTVTSVRPLDASTGNPMNSVVQINFSEAVNPSTATGEEDGSGTFTNITTIGSLAGLVVKGKYQIANQYRTVELETTNLCGVNSCGGNVFCLPGGQTIDVKVRETIMDMAGNKLDQDGDGNGGEATEDEKNWSFDTSSDIDLDPPIIIDMEDINNISLTDPINVTFDSELSAVSVDTNNVKISGVVPISFWASLSGGNVISINHDKFDPSSVYNPMFKSDIKDLRQNCWYPAICDDSIAPFSCVSDTDLSANCAAGKHCEGF